MCKQKKKFKLFQGFWSAEPRTQVNLLYELSKQKFVVGKIFKKVFERGLLLI